MSKDKLVISGTGCALADFLYNGISFNSPKFKKYLSEKAGDGGLSPGKLVFTEELEKYSGLLYQEIIGDIIGHRIHDACNVGGPSIVSLIHASQLLYSLEYEVKFFGMAGDDETAKTIFEIVSKTPLNIDNYLSKNKKTTPFTHVLSDPTYDNGHGERTFINNIGAAWEFTPRHLDNGFYNSDIVCFGGTALVPQIHDNLTELLAKAKKNNCISMVNTVFDFRNEKNNPTKPWPLGKSDESYRLINILIMDREEALRLSGRNTIEEASKFFKTTEVSSFIITNGANNIHIWSGGGLFEKQELIQMPVSRRVTEEIRSNPDQKGDTTGCGDNFAGGIISSLAWQLKTRKKGQLSLIEALSWGVASGGFTCFTIGGTYLEKTPGEKLARVKEIQRDYLHQIENQIKTVPRKKILIFGAGKIGRSFIGQLFSRGGYEVVFVDVAEQIIDELNLKKSYNVIIKSDKGEELIKIENVRGVHTTDEEMIVNELVTAEILAVSVGLNGLGKIFPLVANGLVERQKAGKNYALDIIIAENMRNADKYFRNELLKYLPGNYPIDKLVGLVETSIGKMVPIMQKQQMEEDILQIFAEPYNTLILNKKAFRNPIPEIEGLAPKENMKAWVDRKLFIHNLGHSAAAYIGYIFNPNMIYVYEALAIPEIFRNVRETMLQAAEILIKKYPGEFTLKDLDEHINDLLSRFQNKALGDTIFRVGCDLKRKLGPEDRLSGAIKSAIELDLPFEKILYALICGCHFRAKDESGNMLKEDVEFDNRYRGDIKSILTEVCGFNKTNNNQIFQEAETIDRILKNIRV
jgi:mannitol-1-phosphate 5-dehydrogenase